MSKIGTEKIPFSIFIDILNKKNYPGANFKTKATLLIDRLIIM